MKINGVENQRHALCEEHLCRLVALFLATIADVIVMMIVLPLDYTPPPPAEISFDLRSIFNHLSYWFIATGALVLGFYWNFRRR